MKKKGLLITFVVTTYLIVFALGVFRSYRMPETYPVEMYATVVTIQEGEGPKSYVVTRIKQDDPENWFEGNQYVIHTDENTKITYQGKDAELKEGDFIRIAFPEKVEYQETFPVTVTPEVPEIECLRTVGE